jgi:hypothetical protein
VQVIGKVNIFLYLTKYYAMKMYGVQIHVFLTMELEVRSASGPGRFTPEEETQVHIVQEAGWAPKPIWMIWRSENSCPYRDSELRLPRGPGLRQSLYRLRCHGCYCTNYTTFNYDIKH